MLFYVPLTSIFWPVDYPTQIYTNLNSGGGISSMPPRLYLFLSDVRVVTLTRQQKYFLYNTDQNYLPY